MFLWLANWWDSADLWLTQLAFPFQFAIVIAVLGPLCLGLALAIDRCVDLVRRQPRHGKIKKTAVELPILVRADVPAGTPGTIITSQPPAPQPPDPPAERAERTPESTGS